MSVKELVAGEITFTMDGASSRKLLEEFWKQDKEYIDRLMDGKESLTLVCGGRRITLVPAKKVAEC
jgi:hypothetical protein